MLFRCLVLVGVLLSLHFMLYIFHLPLKTYVIDSSRNNVHIPSRMYLQTPEDPYGKSNLTTSGVPRICRDILRSRPQSLADVIEDFERYLISQGQFGEQILAAVDREVIWCFENLPYLTEFLALHDHHDRESSQHQKQQQNNRNKLHRMQNKKQILIMTSFHSGSSFVGRFFKAHASVFYIYEPLHLIALYNTWKKPRIRQHLVSYYLRRLFTCDLRVIIEDSIKRYTNSTKRRQMWTNACFGKYVNMSRNLAGVKELEEECKWTGDNIVIKTIRVDSIISILPLIMSGVKVIYLIRDPRGLTNSRLKHYKNPRAPKLRMLKMECSKNARNFKFLQEITQINFFAGLFEKHFKILRYEDIASNPMAVSRAMFQFCGIGFSRDVQMKALDMSIPKHKNKQLLEQREHFLQSKLVNKDGNLSPLVTSKSIAMAWKKTMSRRLTKRINKICINTLMTMKFVNALNYNDHSRSSKIFDRFSLKVNET